MKRGRKKKLAISLMDYMGKRRDMKRQLKKEGTAEWYEQGGYSGIVVGNKVLLLFS